MTSKPFKSFGGTHIVVAALTFEWKSRFAVSRNQPQRSNRLLIQRKQSSALVWKSICEWSLFSNPAIRLADTETRICIMSSAILIPPHFGSLFADLTWWRSTWRRGRPVASWDCSCWSLPVSRSRSRTPQLQQHRPQIRSFWTKTNAPGATSKAAGANEDGKICR